MSDSEGAATDMEDINDAAASSSETEQSEEGAGEGSGDEGDEGEVIESTICDVCGDDASYEDNAIVLCDGCDVAVHVSCYGIRSIPEGDWFCDPCHLGLKPNALACLLCKEPSGALVEAIDDAAKIDDAAPSPPSKSLEHALSSSSSLACQGTQGSGQHGGSSLRKDEGKLKFSRRGDATSDEDASDDEDEEDEEEGDEGSGEQGGSPGED